MNKKISPEIYLKDFKNNKKFDAKSWVIFTDHPTLEQIEMAQREKKMLIALIETPEKVDESFIERYMKKHGLDIHPRFSIYLYPQGGDITKAKKSVIQDLNNEYKKMRILFDRFPQIQQ